MIARCPQCQTRYRIAREKIGSQGARIRCSSCQTIFRVQSPPESAPAAAAPATSPPLARALIAEPDASVAKAVSEFLAERRIASVVVDDGGEALLHIHRSRPDLVVLGANLPGVRSAVIAELLRRSAELRDLPAIRVAPLDEPAGEAEFDASATLEPGDLPAGLGPILERMGLGEAPAPPKPPLEPPAPPPPIRTAPAAPPVRPVPAPAPSPAPAPAAPAPARSGPAAAKSADPEVAKAERLARITISDIILYNERKFATAAASGKVAEALAHELEEARQHFNSRVAEQTRAGRDFLLEELQRRAAQHRG